MGELKNKIAILVLFSVLFLAGVSRADTQSQALVLHEKGRFAFSNKEYDKAMGLFEQAYKLNPNLETNLHWLGTTYLKLERFSEAEKYLQELLTKNPGYSNAYFDLGLSLYRLGKFSTALPWFEKERGQKENPLPLFYAGLTHHQLGNEAEAIALLKQVKVLFPASETATAAQEWIAKIESKEVVSAPPKAKRWSLNTTLGFFYDSNIVRDPDNENLAGFIDIGDMAATGSAEFQYLLVPKEKAKFYIGASTYQSAYSNLRFDSNNFNYGRHKGFVQLVRRVNDSVQFRFPAEYSFSTLGKAKFVQSGEGEMIADLAWMKDFLTTVTAGIRKDWFFGTFTSANQNRDAYKGYGRLEHYFFSPRNRNLYIKGGYGAERNVAKGSDWDYWAHTLYFTAQTPFFLKTKFLLITEIVPRRYFQYTDSVFTTRRLDKSGVFTAAVSKDLPMSFTAGVNYTFAIQASNIQRFRYRRHVAGLTFSRKW